MRPRIPVSALPVESRSRTRSHLRAARETVPTREPVVGDPDEGRPQPQGQCSEQLRNSAPRRVVGRPFRPGQSGNPGGRPRGLAGRIREATREGADLVTFAMRVLNGETRGVTMRDRLEALYWLADRGWGKPVQSVELSGTQELVPPAIALSIFQILANPDQARRVQDATVGAIQQGQAKENPALQPAPLTAR